MRMNRISALFLILSIGILLPNTAVLGQEKAAEGEKTQKAETQDESKEKIDLTSQAEAPSVSLAVKMMEEVKRREQDLVQREESLRQKEEKLRALEKEIVERIKALKELEKKRTKEEEDKINQLAKVFESSAPEEAANLLSNLPPEIGAEVLSRMNARKAGRLWGYVDPEKATEISKILSKRF